MVGMSDLLRQARLTRGLTMAGLANLAQVPTSTISRIESGKIDPTVAMFSRIAQAAGYLFEVSLTESGSDQPLANAIQALEEAKTEERGKLLARFPRVATTAPVTRRLGMVRVAVPGNISTAIECLNNQGQNPIVSGLEAVAESISRTRSFIPLVYVDAPNQVVGFDTVVENAFQVMLLLPTTQNVRSWTRVDLEVPMVTAEWGWLDAMASPGRQSDIAREQFELLIMESV